MIRVGLWVGFAVAVLTFVGGVAMVVYGVGVTVSTWGETGREWSMEELYECELAPSCDEAAAAEESRLAGASPSARDAVPLFMTGLIVSVMAYMGARVALDLIKIDHQTKKKGANP